MFSARIGFFAPAITKEWYQYTNTEISAEIVKWQRATANTLSSYSLGSTIHNAENVYRGHIAHPNGKIYAAPGVTSKTTIFEFDPTGPSAREISTGLTLSGSVRYIAGCVGRNGKIYWVPRDMNKVMIYDPVANVASLENWGLTMSGYFVAAKADDKIYAIGSRADILVVDMTANTAYQTTYGGIISGSESIKWSGGVRSVKNNKIYFSPYNKTSVLIIDPAANTAVNTTYNLTFGTNASQGTGNGKDGNVYITPHEQLKVYRLDPEANTITQISASGLQSLGATLCNDGNVYTSPWNGVMSTATASHVIDVQNNVLVSVGYSSVPRLRGILHPNGNVYSFPASTSNNHVLIHDFGGRNYSTEYMAVIPFTDYQQQSG